MSYETGRQRVFVWNPSIRRCVEVVDEIGYGYNFWAQLGIGTGIGIGIGFGFGFDCVSDDYKVVSIALYFNEWTGDFEHEAKVYSVREGWLKSVAVLSSCIPPSDSYGVDCSNTVFLNGCVNWVLSVHCRADGGVIDDPYYYDRNAYTGIYFMRFNVHGEVVDTMLSPIAPIKDMFLLSVAVGEINDCLALYSYPGDESECSIWRMTEYGVAESWTMLFNVKILDLGRSKIRMVIREDDEIESVSDQTTTSKKVLDSEPILPASVTSRVDAYLLLDKPMETYVESLVLLDLVDI